MANPAAILLEIFKRWSAAPEQVNNTNNKSQLGKRRRVNTPEGLRDHVDAMVALRAIEFHLDRLSGSVSVDSYTKMVPVWCRAVLAYPHGWSHAGANSEILTEHAMDSLEHLAVLIDSNLPGLRAFDDAPYLTLLDEIQQELASDQDLPEDLKVFVFNLVLETRNALAEFDTLGAVNVADCLQRLKVALFAAADQTKGEHKKRYRGFATHVALPLAVNLATGVALRQIGM